MQAMDVVARLWHVDFQSDSQQQSISLSRLITLAQLLNWP
jgi:hypothetical protein